VLGPLRRVFFCLLRGVRFEGGGMWGVGGPTTIAHGPLQVAQINFQKLRVERAAGIGPTSRLGGPRSTIELRPLAAL
jgi:hypothetical protein